MKIVTSILSVVILVSLSLNAYLMSVASENHDSLASQAMTILDLEMILNNSSADTSFLGIKRSLEMENPSGVKVVATESVVDGSAYDAQAIKYGSSVFLFKDGKYVGTNLF